MEIIYLKQLRDNPAAYPDDTDYKGEIQPISLSEIIDLELSYNNGSPFPKALRELLYLAGRSCYIFDYGGEIDAQNYLQEWVGGRMNKHNRTITRPFYALDIYNALDQFVFIYLDEGEDPPVYEGVYGGIDESGIETVDGWIHKLTSKLSEYINISVDRVKKGENPF